MVAFPLVAYREHYLGLAAKFCEITNLSLYLPKPFENPLFGVKPHKKISFLKEERNFTDGGEPKPCFMT